MNIQSLQIASATVIDRAQASFVLTNDAGTRIGVIIHAPVALVEFGSFLPHALRHYGCETWFETVLELSGIKDSPPYDPPALPVIHRLAELLLAQRAVHVFRTVDGQALYKSDENGVPVVASATGTYASFQDGKWRICCSLDDAQAVIGFIHSSAEAPGKLG